ncbi:CHASE2 domain-containing protein [Roseateles puraquae]|uniref:CHASE2 domain-containing protein n=1 Tax=Roseateles puraquae TaxID=431059 RepID=UPI0031D85EC4
MTASHDAALQSPAASAERPPWGWRSIAIFLIKGFAVATLLIGIKLGLEQTPLGRWAELQTRALLLQALPGLRETGPDAIVVDISHIAGGERDPVTGRLKVTSREDLKLLIRRLSDLGALAIGVDIDFSTEGGDWLSPSDPAFFDFCLETNQKTPVRLGVWRSLVDPEGHWLELPRYQQLAAALFVTDSATGHVPISVGLKGAQARLPTLGAALAAATGQLPMDPYGLLKSSRSRLQRFVFDETVTRELQLRPSSVTLQTHEAPVNFSVLQQIAREYIPRATPDDLLKYASRLQGRIVLLGAAEKTTDLFVVPGNPRNKPGVFLHAAQAHTFTTEPVYEFSHAFRLVLDLVVSAVLLLTVVAFRRWSRNDVTAAHRLERRVLLGLCLTIALGAIALMVWCRVFWLDFILVALFLILHGPTEHALMPKESADAPSH